MSLIQLAVAQLIAAAIGIALQLSSSGRARAAISRAGGRRILGGGVGLIVALALWDTICIFVKLFTWKPFAGDAPGSVEATAVLCLAGSAVAGFFASKWIFRPPQSQAD